MATAKRMLPSSRTEASNYYEKESEFPFKCGSREIVTLPTVMKVKAELGTGPGALTCRHCPQSPPTQHVPGEAQLPAGPSVAAKCGLLPAELRGQAHSRHSTNVC